MADKVWQFVGAGNNLSLQIRGHKQPDPSKTSKHEAARLAWRAIALWVGSSPPCIASSKSGARSKAAKASAAWPGSLIFQPSDLLQ